MNLYHVTKFSSYFPFTLYCFYTKISSFMPVLTIGIVRGCFYLLIFYSEKFSTWVCRLPFAVNVNLNLSIIEKKPGALFMPVTEFWLAWLFTTVQDKNENQENYSRWACFSNEIFFLHVTGHILEQIFLVKYITLKSNRQINLKLDKRRYRKSQIRKMRLTSKWHSYSNLFLLLYQADWWNSVLLFSLDFEVTAVSRCENKTKHVKLF